VGCSVRDLDSGGEVIEEQGENANFDIPLPNRNDTLNASGRLNSYTCTPRS
jgi:hypothetical protein